MTKNTGWDGNSGDNRNGDEFSRAQHILKLEVAIDATERQLQAAEAELARSKSLAATLRYQVLDARLSHAEQSLQTRAQKRCAPMPSFSEGQGKESFRLVISDVLEKVKVSAVP